MAEYDDNKPGALAMTARTALGAGEGGLKGFAGGLGAGSLVGVPVALITGLLVYGLITGGTGFLAAPIFWAAASGLLAGGLASFVGASIGSTFGALFGGVTGGSRELKDTMTPQQSLAQDVSMDAPLPELPPVSLAPAIDTPAIDSSPAALADLSADKPEKVVMGPHTAKFATEKASSDRGPDKAPAGAESAIAKILGNPKASFSAAAAQQSGQPVQVGG